MASKSVTALPGFGKAVQDQRRAEVEEGHNFPNAITMDHEALILPVREYTIMELVNVMTDKPEWQRKVYDEAITSKWRSEILGKYINHDASNHDEASNDNGAGEDQESSTGRDADDQMSAGEDRMETASNQSEDSMSDSGSETSSATHREPDVTEKMVDWAIAEVKYKADLFQDCDCVEALDGVWKSDTTVSEALKTELKDAAAVFEDVPEKDMDWHPGSEEQVLDLVHPSIYPLVYGQSQILDGDECGVNDCLSWIGKGQTIPEPSDDDSFSTRWWSKEFQWLPSEFDVPPDTEDVHLKSYINNVHPEHHPKLYSVIPKFVAKAIPLWNRVLSHVTFDSYIPPRVSDWSNSDGNGYQKDLQEPPQEDGENDDDHYDRIEAWRDARPVIEPEPTAFMTPKERLMKPAKRYPTNVHPREPVDRDPPDVGPEVDLRRDFGRLQIIVKLANIHLTPDKPHYGGGTWHVEGQANEAICATALYYYDSENITDSSLAFRQHTEDALELPYEQSDHRAMEQIYGFTNNDPTIQNLGAVNTREGRLLCFPNVMQHQVSSFDLKDPTKPGHRKILALFLVDPHCKIISTANVPPQQHSWWKELVEVSGVSNRLPIELWQNVLNLSDFPVSLEVAKKQRKKLMKERRTFVGYHNAAYESKNTFSLCEH